MKSRTSFFNGAAFRKNLTRFAPVWGLYTLCLLLGLVLLCESGVEYWLSAHLCECVQIMVPINLIYALVCAQVLFGDLYSSRMCNALHAMPIRREGWFAVHVTSGLFFSLVPTAIMTAVALGLSAFSMVTDAWQIPLWWWLGTNLEFICFFGIAVFSAFCAGNRLAMGVVYGILNFFAVLVYWVVDAIYTPMLYGIEVHQEQFLPFTPVSQMVVSVFLDCQRIYAEDEVHSKIIGAYFNLGSEWWYYLIYAAVGVALVCVALLLYRKRKLECAGDFMAVKALEPVFLVLFTVTAAVMVQLVWHEFTYDDTYVFLFIGLIIGYFVGRMLLERTAKVFRLKNWFGLVLLAVAIAASLVITALDPLGLVTWVPKAEDVKQVELLRGYYYEYNDERVLLDDPQEIADALYIHEQSLLHREEYNQLIPVETFAAQVTEPGVPVAQANAKGTESLYKQATSILLRYTMKDGSVRNRYLTIWVQGEAGDVVKRYFSSLSSVLGVEDLTDIQDTVYSIRLGGMQIPMELWGQEDVPSLLQAIEEDAAAGNLMQHWAFHDSQRLIGKTDEWEVDAIRLEFQMGEKTYEFNVYPDSEHILKWLNDRGLVEYYMEHLIG